MSKYPSYACQCCGVTNGDMFYDRDTEPTPEEIAEFNMYRKMWYILKEDREQMRNEVAAFRTTRLRKHTDETRAKISATIRANKVRGAETGVENG